MKSQLHVVVAALVVLLAEAVTQPAFAQTPYNQPPSYGQPGMGAYRPTVSPYLNLFNTSGSNTGLQYYNQVLPQQRYNSQIGQLQGQTAQNAMGLQQDQALYAGLTGHPVYFLNYRYYFLNLSARAGQASGMGGAGAGGANFGAGIQGARGGAGGAGASRGASGPTR